jgi:hypothetical protein
VFWHIRLNIVWQSGVILAKDNTRAEVIEYYNRREMIIRVAGRDKRDYLTNNSVAPKICLYLANK